MALGVWLAKIADPATKVLSTKASATIFTVNLSPLVAARLARGKHRCGSRPKFESGPATLRRDWSSRVRRMALFLIATHTAP